MIAGPRTYDAVVMDRAPRLRVIARTGIGYDGVDVAAATDRGIAICNTPDGPTISTAEHAIALMLAVAKNVPAAQAALRDGHARVFRPSPGHRADGKSLGLVGFGRIARHVARIADGLGMRVSFVDPFVDATAVPPGVTHVESLEALLAVGGRRVGARPAHRGVARHVRHDPVRGDESRVPCSSTPPAAVWSTTTRCSPRSSRATCSGPVWMSPSPEPLPPDHPLLGRDDVLVTPHVASATAEGKARIFRVAFAQAMAVLEGRRPEHLVNPEVWERISTTLQAGVGR